MAGSSEFFRYVNALEGAGIDWTQGLSAQDIRNVRGWANSMGPFGTSYTDPGTGFEYGNRNSIAELDPIMGIWRKKYGMDPGTTGEVKTVDASTASDDRPAAAALDSSVKDGLARLNSTAPLAPARPDGSPAGELPKGESKDAEDRDTEDTKTVGVDKGVQKTIQEQLGDNAQAKKEAETVLGEVNSAYAAVASEINDPTTLRHYQQTLKLKLDQLQDVLSNAKVSAEAREKVLEAFRNAYDKVAPDRGNGAPADSTNTGGESKDAAGGTGGESGGGGMGGDTGGGVGNTDEGLVDPFAGLGMLPGAGAAMDPLAGALGQLPAALGGLAGAPTDALGGLGSLAGLAPAFAGMAKDGFTDPGATDKDDSEFTDEKPEEPKDDSEFTDEKPEEPGGQAEGGGDRPPGVEPAAQPAPEAAAPAAAAVPEDPGTAVTLPNGQVVEAGGEQAAAVMRAVLTGSSVTDAFKDAGVDLPPPGTPVTAPVAPSALAPGSVGHFQAREPVLAMGNGKVWLDGQVQSMSALGSSPDFLGWSSPLAAPRSTVAASAAS